MTLASSGERLACTLHSLMSRTPRTKAEAVLTEGRIEDGRQHLQQGLLDHPIQRRRHPQVPHPAGGLGDRHPPHRSRPLGARLEPRPNPQPMLMKPRPQLLGTHPVDTSDTGVFPPRPLTGMAAIITTPTSTNVLRPETAFGPSRHPATPAGTTASADSSAAHRSLSAPTAAPTRRTRSRSGISLHPQRPPRITPATFPAHPPRLRNGLLITTGFAVPCRLAQAAPPPTRSTRDRSHRPARHLFPESRVRPRLPPHPTSR